MDLVFEPSVLRQQTAEVVCGRMADFFGGAGVSGDLAEGFRFQANGRMFLCHISGVRADGTPVVVIRPLDDRLARRRVAA